MPLNNSERVKLEVSEAWKIPKTEAKLSSQKTLRVFHHVLAIASCWFVGTLAFSTPLASPHPNRVVPLHPRDTPQVYTDQKFGGYLAGSGCCHCNDHHFDRLFFATLYGLRFGRFFVGKKRGWGPPVERWGFFFVMMMRVGRWWWWWWWWWLFLNALRFQLVICIYVGGVFGMMFLRQYLPGKERFFLQVMGRCPLCPERSVDDDAFSVCSPHMQKNH